MRASTVLVPTANTVHRLGTTTHCALNIAVSKRTRVAVMGRGSLHSISAALLVLVSLVVMLAGTVVAPTSQAVHRLGTALRGALLVGIDVWASESIVGRVCADGIVSAAPVLVVLAVMEASAIGTPVSSTVHRLAATILGALDLVVRMRTLLAIEILLGGDLVGSAALVLVSRSLMLAASIGVPLALAVHRLAAAALRALCETILMRTSKATVQVRLGDTVHSAALVVVIILVVMASVIHAPGTNTVHRLGTLLSGALLKLVGIWASISIVGGLDRDLVQSAALVAVSFLIVITRAVLIPGTNTVHRLGT